MTVGTRAVATKADERLVVSGKTSVLQELERQGYLLEPQPPGSGTGVICRHLNAPNLLVRDDGRVELLSTQPDAQALMLPPYPINRIRWRRGMLILTLLGVATFLGLLMVAMIVG